MAFPQLICTRVEYFTVSWYVLSTSARVLGNITHISHTRSGILLIHVGYAQTIFFHSFMSYSPDVPFGALLCCIHFSSFVYLYTLVVLQNPPYTGFCWNVQKLDNFLRQHSPIMIVSSVTTNLLWVRLSRTITVCMAAGVGTLNILWKLSSHWMLFWIAVVSNKSTSQACVYNKL